MSVRSRWQRLVERILPWFDPAAEALRDAQSEAVRQRAIAARIGAERVREDYRKVARRVTR